MFTEARCAWFKACDERARVTPDRVLGLLATSARRASEALDVTLGKLEPDAVADVVITDYHPSTPLTSENLAGHFLFALGAQHVRHVIADGQWALRERAVSTCDELQVRSAARDLTPRLWERMAALPLD